MTDNEIIKALECCSQLTCSECPYYEKRHIRCRELRRLALDLIKRQKAEIERLRKHLNLAEQCISEVEDAAYRGGSNDYIDSAIERYNTIVKEMTEEDERK